MKVTVVGCGDAFGSGGRLNTCFHVQQDQTRFLIDCGATSLIGMQQCGLAPDHVATIFISHLHGDHFAGLVWWLLHAQHVSKRTAPLTIVGPRTIERRFYAAAEILFEGSTNVPSLFALDFVEYEAGRTMTMGPVMMTPFLVDHPSGAPSCALRFETGGKILTFSGDTQWVEQLVPAAANADLFIVECYNFDIDTRGHLSWRTIERNLEQITAKKVMLTHMNERTLAQAHTIENARIMLADDGLQIEL